VSQETFTESSLEASDLMITINETVEYMLEEGDKEESMVSKFKETFEKENDEFSKKVTEETKKLVQDSIKKEIEDEKKRKEDEEAVKENASIRTPKKNIYTSLYRAMLESNSDAILKEDTNNFSMEDVMFETVIDFTALKVLETANIFSLDKEQE